MICVSASKSQTRQRIRAILRAVREAYYVRERIDSQPEREGVSDAKPEGLVVQASENT